MTERGPEFRELVGDDLEPEQEAQLRRVHELLVAAGPPPELPPALVQPPEERGTKVIGFPVRRRLGVAVVLAAAIAAAAFGGGYAVGHRGGFQAEGAPIPMHGSTPAQLASIRLSSKDDAGNWPLLLRVKGLPDLPKGGYYELLLSRNGKPGPSCGTFRVHHGVTQIVLNAPYKLRAWDGWVIVQHLPGRAESGPILST